MVAAMVDLNFTLFSCAYVYLKIKHTMRKTKISLMSCGASELADNYFPRGEQCWRSGESSCL